LTLCALDLFANSRKHDTLSQDAQKSRDPKNLVFTKVVYGEVTEEYRVRRRYEMYTKDYDYTCTLG